MSSTFRIGWQYTRPTYSAGRKWWWWWWWYVWWLWLKKWSECSGIKKESAIYYAANFWNFEFSFTTIWGWATQTYTGALKLGVGNFSFRQTMDDTTDAHTTTRVINYFIVIVWQQDSLFFEELKGIGNLLYIWATIRGWITISGTPLWRNCVAIIFLCITIWL